ncbi:MAG TPA: hypothetical protein VFQ45_13420 [Longimicrobium sp.]|nr:hypothetical protein [Longimicrobium sp.]
MPDIQIDPAEAAIVQMLRGNPGLGPLDLVEQLEKAGQGFSTHEVRRAIWNLVDRGEARFVEHRRVALAE